jgi:hypothetical protein
VSVRKHETCDCRLGRALQTRYGGDLEEIATGRFREAGESTGWIIAQRTPGNCYVPPVGEYTVTPGVRPS